MPLRTVIERLLRDAEQRVSDGRDIIAQQKVIIAELEVEGCDSARAHALLKTYHALQSLAEDMRDRLKEELILRAMKRALLH